MPRSSKWCLSGFLVKIAYTLFYRPMLAKYPAYLILLDLSPKQYMMMSTSYKAPHYAVCFTYSFSFPIRNTKFDKSDNR
jgi:hypothetical protein